MTQDNGRMRMNSEEPVLEPQFKRAMEALERVSARVEMHKGQHVEKTEGTNVIQDARNFIVASNNQYKLIMDIDWTDTLPNELTA